MNIVSFLIYMAFLVGSQKQDVSSVVHDPRLDQLYG
jgi:hypothetical protein